MKSKTIEILEITVILTDSMDLVQLNTNFPASSYPFIGNLVLSFNAGKDLGKDYVVKNFGIEPKVINAR